MEVSVRIKILFVINSFSGNKSRNWIQIINIYFQDLNYIIELFVLNENFNAQEILKKIELFNPDKVIAVG